MSVNLTKIGTSLTAPAIAALPATPVASLYVHVPFCAHKCEYCDFYSLPGQSRSLMAAYTRSACREVEWWSRYLQRTGSRISTVFLGGGTPTLLPIDLMRDLLTCIRTQLPFEEDYEWTVEANPATIDPAYCAMMLQAGVNRLSIGAQSLVDAELKTLGRIHSANQVTESVKTAQSAGFRRLSIDLMYATPRQTPESWQYTLEGAIALGIDHLSCYCLTLEEDTPMYRQTRAALLPEVGEETQLEYMRRTRSVLPAHGYQGYEISNYARAGEECRHNLVYWDCGNYIGIGPGAATHLNGLRWRHAPDVSAYVASMDADEDAPLVDVEQLTQEQRGTELIMMSLRTNPGLRWGRFAEVTGRDGEKMLAAAIKRLSQMNLVEPVDGGVRLTPQGVFVAETVIGELVREAT